MTTCELHPAARCEHYGCAFRAISTYRRAWGGRVDRPWSQPRARRILTVMAISKNDQRGGFRILPVTPSGWFALAFLGLSLVLLAARLVLKPLAGLPLNFLIVFVAFAASGLIALFAVVFQRERSVGVFATLMIGLLAGIWLAAEALGPQAT
jgi:hypothetical protein